MLWVKNGFGVIDSSNQCLIFQHTELSYVGFFVLANHTARQESAILCIIPSKPEHKEAEKRFLQVFQQSVLFKCPSMAESLCGPQLSY